MNILKVPREAAVPRKFLVKVNLTLDCSMIKATMGTVNFAACSNNRPHFTKNNQDLKRSKPIRKSSIILRSRKTLIILLHPLLFSPASQNFLYGLCGWRFLRWRQLAQLCSRNFLFPRSPSSLAFRLFIVWNLDSFHEIFFRGARIRRTRKKKIQIQIKIQRWSALLRIFFASVKNLQRIK